MAKQDESMIPFHSVTRPSLVPIREPQTPQEREVAAKLELHLQQQHGYNIKERVAQIQIAEMHDHAHEQVFHTSASMFARVKQPGLDAEHRKWFAEYSGAQLTMLGRHSLGTVEAGASAIARVAYDPLTPDPTPAPPTPRHRSLLEKLLGP